MSERMAIPVLSGPSVTLRPHIEVDLGPIAGHALGELGWELVAWQANVGSVASYKAA